jgi:predicted nucleic-acid-binding protein
LTRAQVAQAIEALLHVKEIVIDRADQVRSAFRLFRLTSADFADCLIERTASNAGCMRTMTFDVGASKLAGMTLVQ